MIFPRCVFRLLALAGFGVIFTNSQHLWYTERGQAGDILVNDVYIDSSASTTYFEVLGWNQGANAGGYTGIQQTPAGNIFIYSIWDPSSGIQVQPSSAVYQAPGTQVSRFGGEGAGIHCLTDPSQGGLTWTLATWYSLVTRVWKVAGDTSNTYWGLWVKSPSGWVHVVTFQYPSPAALFQYGAMAFLENYGSSSLSSFRKMRTANGWKRYTSDGSWGYFLTGALDSGTVGGITSTGEFYMATQANLPSNVSSSNRYQNAKSATSTKPSFNPIVVSGSLAYNAAAKTVTVSWTTDVTLCPQFGYTIKVYSSSNAATSLISTSVLGATEIKSVPIDVSSLSVGASFNVVLTLQDLVDNVSPPYAMTFAITDGPPTQSPTGRTSSPSFRPNTRSPTNKPLTSTTAPTVAVPTPIFSLPNTNVFTGSNSLNSSSLSSALSNTMTLSLFIKTTKVGAILMTLGRTPANYFNEFFFKVDNFGRLNFIDYANPSIGYGFNNVCANVVTTGQYIYSFDKL